MQPHKIVSREGWIEARKAHLAHEKEYTRARDRLSEARRALPWVKVEKAYVFDGPKGKQTLADLFAGRSQLVVQHFMFAPDWTEGCKSCSFWADGFDGFFVHLAQRDVAYVAVSRATLAEIEAYKKRMGWTAKWVSSYGSDFNFDYGVSFTKDDETKGTMHYNYGTEPYRGEEVHGLSVFSKKETGDVFHTYSAYARGPEELLGFYFYLDR
ncbi:MAG TPA: thioredoxin family protein, partial [Bradyrhizobium sp.]|nr:thioredoxin family protein [Bradyrhizobium sp.]